MYSFDIVDRAQRAGIRLVRFLWCGSDGVVRTKGTGVESLEGRLDFGVPIPAVAQATNILGEPLTVDGVGGDLRLAPDFESYRVLPYAPHTAALICDLAGPGSEPAPVCPRTFLKRAVERLIGREAALQVSFENEFVLARVEDGRPVPIDAGTAYSTAGLAAAQAYADELVDALTRQEIQIEHFHAAAGAGRYELSTSPLPALEAADRQLLVRETIRAVASRHGLVASLTPRPWLDGPGSRSHVSFSLWDDIIYGNRFFDEEHPLELRREGRAFLAGVLEHLPGLCGLAAPSYSSYRHESAGGFACWGTGNRGAPLRVPPPLHGLENTTARAELRAADASCNPYLAVGGILTAGLDGLTRELDLPDPVDTDPTTLSAADRKRLGLFALPATQAEALDALEADAVLVEAAGDALLRTVLAVRRAEWQAFSAGDEAFELQGHLAAY